MLPVHGIAVQLHPRERSTVQPKQSALFVIGARIPSCVHYLRAYCRGGGHARAKADGGGAGGAQHAPAGCLNTTPVESRSKVRQRGWAVSLSLSHAHTLSLSLPLCLL
jgi:hypothetical protein